MLVSVDEVKTHLRIDQDEEDVYLESLIRQAQAAAEDYCRVSFGDDAPEPVRLAILLFVGFYYENRDVPDRTTYGSSGNKAGKRMRRLRDSGRSF